MRRYDFEMFSCIQFIKVNMNTDIRAFVEDVLKSVPYEPTRVEVDDGISSLFESVSLLESEHAKKHKVSTFSSHKERMRRCSGSTITLLHENCRHRHCKESCRVFRAWGFGGLM